LPPVLRQALDGPLPHWPRSLFLTRVCLREPGLRKGEGLRGGPSRWKEMTFGERVCLEKRTGALLCTWLTASGWALGCRLVALVLPLLHLQC